MKIPNPFGWIKDPACKPVFGAFLVASLLLLVCLNLLDRPLKTDAAPQGIVSFELAGSLPAATAMMASWGTRAKLFAAISLGLDYLFLVVYAAAIGLGCVLAANGLANRRVPIAALGMALAWGQALAALLDAVENYALIQVLLGTASRGWPFVARFCAIPKFALVAAGLVYMIAGATLFVIKKR